LAQEQKFFAELFYKKATACCGKSPYVTLHPMSDREALMTEVSLEVLSALRNLAREEGIQIQALVDEALTDLIEKRRLAQPRPHVMGAYQASHEKYAELYQKLAQ